MNGNVHNQQVNLHNWIGWIIGWWLRVKLIIIQFELISNGLKLNESSDGICINNGMICIAIWFDLNYG